MSEYRKTFRLKAEHVDCFRKLRIPVLMRLFQECCIAHTEQLGMGREKTLDKGLLWVVNAETVRIDRMPEYDEEITLVCRPGRTLHYFFPRFMSVLGTNGETLARVGAMWSLIDISSRRMTDPAENGITVEGESLPGDLLPAMSLPVRAYGNERVFTANYSCVDINGHMNNAAYIDLALDLIPPEEVKNVSEVKCVFKKEIALGEAFAVLYGKSGNVYAFGCGNFLIEIS